MFNQSADAAVQWLQTANAGQRITSGGVSVTLKITSAESDGHCAVVEITIPPHFMGMPAHVHQQTTELFYLLSGSLAFTLGEETVIARQASFVLVKPGTAHRFWNPTDTPASCLVYLSPGGSEQFFVELAALLAEERTASAITALGRAYDQYPA